MAELRTRLASRRQGIFRDGLKVRFLQPKTEFYSTTMTHYRPIKFQRSPWYPNRLPKAPYIHGLGSCGITTLESSLHLALHAPYTYVEVATAAHPRCGVTAKLHAWQCRTHLGALLPNLGKFRVWDSSLN